MDAARFDRLTRSLAAVSSRRVLLRGLASLGLAVGHVPDITTARKRKKTVKFNDFGCVDVGNFCKHAEQCCSGICKGKHPGKGKCKAHDVGGCRPGQDSCTSEAPCTTSTGFSGECFTTTGNAGYCAAGNACTACTNDADCVLELGPGAACVQCDPSGCGIPIITTVCKSPSPD